MFVKAELEEMNKTFFFTPLSFFFSFAEPRKKTKQNQGSTLKGSGGGVSYHKAIMDEEIEM